MNQDELDELLRELVINAGDVATNFEWGESVDAGEKTIAEIKAKIMADFERMQAENLQLRIERDEFRCDAVKFSSFLNEWQQKCIDLQIELGKMKDYCENALNKAAGTKVPHPVNEKGETE